MSNLQDLLSQKANLDAEISRVRSTERAEAVARIKDIMRTYDLTVQDLGKLVRLPGGAARTANSTSPLTGSKAPIKYRDPQTGATWSGRGLMPNWLKARVNEGATKEQFAA